MADLNRDAKGSAVVEAAIPQVGITEVARVAGVAVGTVSNVLNHPERVSDSLRLRVVAVINQLGYVPNEAARSLRLGVKRVER